jgi:hypothetical protein
MFAAHLRSDLTLCATTIDQYFSHAINSLKENRRLDNTATLRSARLKMMLKTFSNEDRVGHPLRTVEKIPLTASLLVVAYDLLSRLYSSATHAARLLGLAAALSLGYGLSLRPDEYLRTNSVANDSHIARGYKSYFMWPDDPTFYVVTPPRLPYCAHLPRDLRHFSRRVEERSPWQGRTTRCPGRRRWRTV